MRRVTAITFILALGFGAGVYGGANTSGHVAVHVGLHTGRSCSKNFPIIKGCADIITTLAGPDADCFPVFYDLVEYQGFDYSITWPGMYSCAFTSCSDLTIGTIVWPGDGISHAWYSCQPGPVAVTGWGWIWDYGMVCLSPHPIAGGPNIGDCSGRIDMPADNSCAGIGGYLGEDPCGSP